MKKLVLILIVGAIGCGPDVDPSFKHAYTVTNNAGFDVTMTCSGCESVTIKDQQTQEVKTNTAFADYVLSPAITTEKKVDFKETSTDKFTLTSYDYDVEYRLTGTATSVNVTIKNETGATVQHPNQVPPKSYQFRDFTSRDLYISAKNNGTGTVAVQIFHKGKVVVGDTNNNANGTATASGSL